MKPLSLVTVKKFKDTVERILHVPGNYRGGILEMAVIVDSRMQKEEVREILPQLLKALKQHGRIFQNVRFNYILWHGQKLQTKVCPMMQAMTDGFYQEYEKAEAEDKDFGQLIDKLKLFQARAKLVILLTGEKEPFWKDEDIQKRMQPFLDKKMMIIQKKEDGISIHYRASVV